MAQRSGRGSGSSQPGAVPWTLRSGLAALGAVCPGLAARASERLFLTPPRHAAPTHEREAVARGERVAFGHRGGVLRGFRMGAGPAVLLVHGWGGRAGQMATFASALARTGCTAIAFDGPAHGGSSGRFASVAHFADALADVAAETGARAAVGHSMGGAAVALALSRGLPVEAAVLVAAPRTPGTWFAQFSEALALAPAVRDLVQARVERRVGMRMVDLDVPRLAPRAPVPLLVVHDRGDREVPFADGEAIAAGWPGARLQATDGLGHRRILRDPGVVAATATFLVERLPRCGCGRLAVCAGPEPRCSGCVISDELWSRERRRGTGAA
jgi:pimeloyl-ACP methyl ester carboxylesterase